MKQGAKDIRKIEAEIDNYMINQIHVESLDITEILKNLAK